MANLPWMKVCRGLPYDQKCRDTAEALGVSPYTLTGHLIALWSQVATFAPDGNVSRFSDQEIAGWAGWAKRPVVFVATLRRFSWIDPDGSLHEWDSWGGAMAAENARKAGEGRAQSARKTRTEDAQSASPLNRDLELEEENPFSDDVETICNLMADLVAKTGAKRPAITDAWRTEAERLRRLDGYSLDEILSVIRWCQSDDFERANVQSITKLRKRYASLRIKAGKASGGHSDHLPPMYDPSEDAA